MKSPVTFSSILLASSIFIFSCTHVNVFEKNVPVKEHSWKSRDTAVISFTITDTSSLYNIFLVLRHMDAYNYNNIWLNIGTRIPGDTVIRQRVPVTLATAEKGWLGSGMDDIFEHRVIIQPSMQFKKPGEYVFFINHIMREDPLQHMMNIGIRVEKQP